MDTDTKRKIVLINRKFQYKMVGKFILLNVVLLIMFGILIYLFLNSEVDANLKSAHVSYNNIKDMLFPIVISLSTISILISSFIIALFVKYASFKIAGPMYRFNQALKEMSDKNLNPVTAIRSDDQLYDCSRSLTNFSQIISSDFNELKKAIAEIKGLGMDSANSELNEKIKRLEEIINQYNT